MLWHILKYYLGYVVGVYFKQYTVKNAKHIKVRGPLIIAMNHPNSVMDPVVFSTLVYPPRIAYLARGDAFKKGLISSLLESLGIIPIFRIQDAGKEGLKKNDETYERVNALLKRNRKIIIFAEGICENERRLRPLKKGVPRMVFGAMEELNLKELTVVPVGLNYKNPTQFRSSVFINIGEPIKMSSYFNDYKESPAKTMNHFLGDLTPKIKELTVHINAIKSEKVIEYIEEIYKWTFIKKEKLDLKNLEHDFIFSSSVINTVNKAEELCEESLRTIEAKGDAYFNDLKKYNIRDWLINEVNHYNLNYAILAIRFLCILVTLPIYLVGLISHYIPYVLTEKIVVKKVKKIEFTTTVRFGVGAILFLISYIVLFTISYLITSSIWLTLLIITLLILAGMFCVVLSPFRKKTMGIYRTLKLKNSQPNVFNELVNKRKEIITLFEELERNVKTCNQ